MTNDFYRRLKPLKEVVNHQSLRLACVDHPEVARQEKELTEAYWRYADHRGCPTFLQPLPLSKECVQELESLYRGEATCYALDWIGRLRHGHGLDDCPFCGSTLTAQVEHYAPREVFPEYMVLSWNLVPTCSLCNGRRNSNQNNPGAWLPMFHPYFEDLLHLHPILGVDRRILKGNLVFLHTVDESRLPGGDLPERVRRHYDVCIHPEQFDNAVAREWRRALIAYGQEVSTSADALEHFLKRREEETMTGIGVNGWPTALYRSMRKDSGLRQQFLDEAATPADKPSYKETRLAFNQPGWISRR